MSVPDPNATGIGTECIIRPAKSVDEAHGLWWPLMQELGWNEGSADCQTHYTSAGPESWFVVTSRDPPDGPQGNIVAYPYSNSTGWIGFFVVVKEARGKRWGAKLFQTALDFFTERSIHTVGLDAVVEQVPTYQRRGFIDGGVIKVLTRPSVEEVPLDVELEPTKPGYRLTPLMDIPLHILIDSDAAHSGLKRDRLWTKEALFHREDARGFAIVKDASTAGSEELDGWILVKTCQHGVRIGPLYANSIQTAAHLLSAILKRLADRDVPLLSEVWSSNPEAVGLFERAGFKDSGVQYHRMWLGGNAPPEYAKGGVAEKQMYAIFDAAEG